MDFSTEVILVVSGVAVGFVNTLAAGASVISITVFMMLGLPVTVANGTNRLPVIFQNLTSSINFRRQNILDLRVGLILGVPMALGSVIGSQVASTVTDTFFKICLGCVLLAVLLFMLLCPESILKGNGREARIGVKHYFWFLAIGFYGGFIYVGVGYLLLAATIAGMGYDIFRANALKGFIILITAPLSLAVFIINGQVDYYYGLLHSAGNIAGAYVASHYASNFGVRFLKWFVIAVIFLTMIDMFGIIKIENILQ